MKTKLLLTLVLLNSLISFSQIIYSDEFNESINNFSSTASLATSLNNNNLEITGNGTSGAWDNLAYTFHNSGSNTTVDASSNPKFYIKVKADNSLQLRIDLKDINGYSTSLYSAYIVPNSSYQIFEIDFTGNLTDGGYGGPCTSGPCPLDATQLTGINFYFNAGTGAYNGVIDIEWLSLGEPVEPLPNTDLNLKNAKVIGYLPDYRFGLSNQIDYTKLTHLNIAFGNPDASGNIIISDFSTVVADAKAQNPNIKILISLAGGGLENTPTATYWSNYIDIPANRPTFISKIVDFVNTNNLDGVDIDLEFDLVTSGYSDFVIELNTALDVYNKLITVALPKVYYPNLTQQALETFDFINMMAYDDNGFWSSNPGQHSSYTFAQDNITFWNSVGNISGEKLVLGVPFYGHNFDTTQFVTYGEMVALNPAYADTDNVGNTFYNGRPTIENKVQLAYNKASGIMIWELGQDSFTQYSLLTTIHEKYTSLNVTTTGLGSNAATLSTQDIALEKAISVYPNPSNGIVNYNSKQNIELVKVFDTTGKEVSKIHDLDKKSINISQIAPGLYYMVFYSSNGTITKKIIKR